MRARGLKTAATLRPEQTATFIEPYPPSAEYGTDAVAKDSRWNG